ncbi:CaiB/BaiF CoA transferase family protein [Thermodesulfobacteriota bacterium]
MLSHCRVLDLTDEKGFLCGKILADLGADVIKVEEPGGDSSRRIGPFWDDVADPEKSLYWFAYNSNKKGITLDIETADGKEILKSLIKASDFVIESFHPGHMEKLDLGYSTLNDINKGIIMTSISPFGQKGPYRDFHASDITLMGMSGLLFMTGERDDPPVNISIPQACLLAGADAAVGSLIAYYSRKMSGQGQHVDVSMQQSAAWFLAMTIPYWELDGIVLERVGAYRTNSLGTIQRQMWHCKDGYIFFFMMGGLQGAKSCRQLVKWMDDEGMGNEYLKAMEWENFDMGTATQEVIDQISRPLEEFFLAHTKDEILTEAVKRSISICPLSDMGDLINDRSLKERGFWHEVEHIELGVKIPYPKQFFKSSEEISMNRFRAPFIGEHNEEVYNALGISKKDRILLKEAGVI